MKGDTGPKGETGPKGDKGDAFTYADFTPDQIATLQKPATDIAAEVKAAEEARAAAEGERQAAETERAESNAKFTAACTATMSAAKEYLSEAEVVSVQAEEIEMKANKYYDITLPDTTTLTLTLQASEDTTHAHDYEGGFTADSTTAPTVTWPEDVTWADLPTLKAGMHYEFSIRSIGAKKYGVVYAW